MPGLVRVWRLTVAPSEEEMERAYAAALRPGQPLADRESSGVGTAVPVPRLLSTAHDHGGSLLHPAGWTRVDPNPPESMQHRLRQRLKRHARARWPHVDTNRGPLPRRFRLRGRRVARRKESASVPPALHRRTAHLGFALYLAADDSYGGNLLPSGLPVGAPREHSTAQAPSASTLSHQPSRCRQDSSSSSARQARARPASGTDCKGADRRSGRGVQPRNPRGALQHLTRTSGSDASDARIFEERDRGLSPGSPADATQSPSQRTSPHRHADDSSPSPTASTSR